MLWVGIIRYRIGIHICVDIRVVIHILIIGVVVDIIIRRIWTICRSHGTVSIIGVCSISRSVCGRIFSIAVLWEDIVSRS